MRNVTQKIKAAFDAGNSLKVGNTHTDGTAVYLHGNKIIERRAGEVWITNAGWSTNTTKERLNGITPARIYQKAGQWYLNGVEWDGGWVRITGGDIV
jgi:hypothetical protein